MGALTHAGQVFDTERSTVTKAKPKYPRKSVTEAVVPPTWKCATKGPVPSGTPLAGRGVQSAVDMVSQSAMSSAEAQTAKFYVEELVTPPAGHMTPENVTWDLARSGLHTGCQKW